MLNTRLIEAKNNKKCSILVFQHQEEVQLQDYYLRGFIAMSTFINKGLQMKISQAEWYKMHSGWPRGLKCGSAAARNAGIASSNPAGACLSVCFECCVLSGTGLCDRPITRPEDSH